MNTVWRSWILRSKIGVIGGLLVLWQKEILANLFSVEPSSIEIAAIVSIVFSAFTWFGFRFQK